MRYLRRALPSRSFHSPCRNVRSQVVRRSSNPVKRVETSNDLQFAAKVWKEEKAENPDVSAVHAKRNEVGVQLLSRGLHSQIFKNVSFPPPDESFITISRGHLAKHTLDPSSSSSHPEISFSLPRLQGPTIDAHFHVIGSAAAEPYLSLAKKLAGISLPPRPERWVIQAGWTKYWPGEDGLHEAVPNPNEEVLVFDVETMPHHHPYPILACAASSTAWYAWISPWLLGQTSETEHLVPIGDPNRQRVVVGHNVSYDRARTFEEYNLKLSGTRWLDTMALHVAVNGISSHQRPAWSKYRKNRLEARLRRDEAVESVLGLIETIKEKAEGEVDMERKTSLLRQIEDMEESLPSLQAVPEIGGESEGNTEGDKRWEDLTSANSLADVARLHCNIEVDKTTRDDFMSATPEEILADITTYLSYCANDVAVTHEVFRKTLPAFLDKCPSPVSFAGVCSMGSSFLTVDENWEHYLASAEGRYRDLEAKVGVALRKLAEEACCLAEGDKWKGDVWLEQLDWTPKASRVKKTSKSTKSFEKEFNLPVMPPPGAFNDRNVLPKWLDNLNTLGISDPHVRHNVLPYLLRLQINSSPVRHHPLYGWHTLGEGRSVDAPYGEQILKPYKRNLVDIFDKYWGPSLVKRRVLKRKGNGSIDVYLAVVSDTDTESVKTYVTHIARRIFLFYKRGITDEERALWWDWIQMLDWTPVDVSNRQDSEVKDVDKPTSTVPTFPQWYRQLIKKNAPSTGGTNPEITVRSRIAPILLKLKWQGWPLVYSREHGWTFRVPKDVLSSGKFSTRQKELSFYHDDDEALLKACGEFAFFKLPHKDGEAANVGSPLSKTFLKYAADGTLSSPGEAAKDALDMNAQCSYWISARDRIMNQMVVWDRDGKQGLPRSGKWGMIIPQVITMGTVTRRAIEKTWLTASNAKANRVGSELKAMVRAPPGYSIVGADVDSEELWISSCMGDAQFGTHGATAVGWMTLEGTKKAGTDLHSKTASILGTSRDQAKVFNYSRIYGAGMKHAILLLLQGNAGMLPEQAQKLAEQLYASTKGKNTHRPDMFGGKFWFGGTESFLFNKLEEIALSDNPQTPALGCGVTYALSKHYLPKKFGSDYLPSRINWVVQSSGVDYLHLLIVSMEHLIQKYDIQARYLISVHDELRYLVKEEDQYRAALALQIANLWTRSLFAYRLGMDDLPQGVAFFSAVDVDKVLRKEVDMSCVTPSQPVPIPPGESLDISAVLQRTNGGSLLSNHQSPAVEEEAEDAVPLPDSSYSPPDCLKHRAKSANWLKAQATDLFEEVRFMAQLESGKTTTHQDAKEARSRKGRRKKEVNSGVPDLQKKSKAARSRAVSAVVAVDEWDGF